MNFVEEILSSSEDENYKKFWENNKIKEKNENELKDIYNVFLDPFSEQVWLETYKDENDKNIFSTFWRIAKAIASVEKSKELKEKWEHLFFEMLLNFKVVPGGRVIANAGTKYKGTTLINCFPEYVNVLTNQGYKEIQNIEIGDLVLTHTGNWKKVIHTMNRRYEGDAYRITNKGSMFDILCTEEHPFYNSRGEWVESKEIEEVVFPRLNGPKDYTTIDLFDYLNYHNSNILKTKDNYLYTFKNFTGGNGANGNKKSDTIKRFIKINEEFAYVMGRFLGDGSTFKQNKDENFPKHGFNIVFSKKENDSLEKCKSILENYLGITININGREKDNFFYLRKNNYIFSSFLYKAFGENYSNKKIPDFIWSSPISVIKSFLIGLIDSDGMVTKKQEIRIVLANKNLSKEVQTLFYLSGIPCNLKKQYVSKKTQYTNNEYFKLEINKGNSYDITPHLSKVYEDNRLQLKKFFSKMRRYNVKFSKDINSFYMRSKKHKEYYNGYVYNISVEEDESYIVNNVVVHNCFVGPRSHEDIDSIKGIMKTLLDQVLTLKSEGGWGMNFSFIRPRGSFIDGIGVETPGSVKYMELFDKSSEIITAGSSKENKKNIKGKKKIRKGAMMGVLDCWHPDIEEFITSKQKEGRLSKFNISVNCTNEFMELINKLILLKEENKPYENLDKWDLIFPVTNFEKYENEWDGNIKKWKENNYPVKIHKTVSALDLWEKITTSTYNRNDPGVLFCDKANLTHCWNYGEGSFIQTTNPCFSEDTLIATADGRGLVSIGQLAKEGKDIPVYSLNKETGFVEIKWGRNPRITGYDQKLLNIKFDSGLEVKVTPNHKFYTMDNRTVEAKDLKNGDSIPRFTKRKESIYKKDKKYWRVNTDVRDSKNKRVFEHRLICKFFKEKDWCEIYDKNKKNGWINGGLVVHHKDYNGLNNSIKNLKIMTFKEHNKFHAEHDFSGEKNPMFGKKHSSETKEKIGDKTKERCKDKNYKEKLRKRILESMTPEYREKISKRRKDFETKRILKEAEKTGLKAIVIDGGVYVEKKCELTNTPFIVRWIYRERCFAPGVQPMDSDRIKEKAFLNRKAMMEKKSKENLHKQVMTFRDLEEELKRIPSKKEWEKECKNKNISTRFNSKSNNQYILSNYKELKEKSKEYNHRVLKIEEIEGEHTVYNITVDKNHTVAIGHYNLCGNIDGIFSPQCGEQSLPYGGVCNLISINLTQFVDIENKKFDYNKIKKYVQYAVRFSDNVNDYTSVPLSEYKESLTKRRRIGLGILGWGSSLYLLNVRFASKKSKSILDDLMKTITHTAVESSIELAKEKGMFDSCDPKKHAENIFWDYIDLPKETLEDIKKHGIRNSSLLSIQPTGNTAILSNIVSSGLEPIFGQEYTRTVVCNFIPDEIKKIVPKYWEGDYGPNEYFKEEKEGEDKILKYKHNENIYKIDKNRGLTMEVNCMDYSVRKLKEIGSWNTENDWAVTAHELSVEDHLYDMTNFSRWIDSSISKTINISKDYPYEEFKKVYLNAYNGKFLKGITTYREGTMTSVLSSKKFDDDKKITKTNATKRPKDLVCDVHHCVRKGHCYVVAVGLIGKDPYEIFVNSNHDDEGEIVIPKNIKDGIIRKESRGEYILKTDIKKTKKEYQITNSNSDENMDAITRIVSTCLRHGADISFIVHQLEKTKGDMQTFSKVLARVLKKYIEDGSSVSGEECPQCGNNHLIRQGGCITCGNCSWTKCF